jgi:two-component system sensor histidine kinase HydH
MRSRVFPRIVAPTMLVSAVLVVLGTIAGGYIRESQQQSATALATNVTKVTAAEELVIISQELRYELSEYLATENRMHLDTASKLYERAGQWIEQCEALANDATESNVALGISDGYQKFYATFALIVSTDPPADLRDLVSHLVRVVVTREILVPVMEYRSMIGRAMDESAQRDQVLADRLGSGLFVLGACGAVGGLAAGFGFARGIQRSIVRLSIPIYDAAGSLNDAVGPIEVASDELGDLEVTMRGVADRVKRVIQELHASQEIARHSERLAALGQLAAGIAHELRTPLTSMKMIVQVASESDGTGSLDERDLDVLSEEISRLETTIQSFLDFARPPELIKRPTDVGKVLEKTIFLVAHRADQMNISIVRRINDVGEIDADARQLRQVLLNLLLNAIEAAPESSEVTVRLSSEQMRCPEAGSCSGDADSGWLRIDVEDHGPGLPIVPRDKIFEPFFTTKDCGTGLGLAICRRIVEGHGGKISAENCAAGGARLTVRLPLREDIRPTAEHGNQDDS